MVMLLHLATGLVLFLTETVAVQARVSAVGSVTVSATVLLPTLLQSKLVLLAERLTPQASVLPPSISASSEEGRAGAESRSRRSSYHSKKMVTSLTVTVALQVELLPLGCVTVSATALLP